MTEEKSESDEELAGADRELGEMRPNQSGEDSGYRSAEPKGSSIRERLASGERQEDYFARGPTCPIPESWRVEPGSEIT